MYITCILQYFPSVCTLCPMLSSAGLNLEFRLSGSVSFRVAYSVCCVTVGWFIAFSVVVESCPTLGDAMDCSTPGLPVPHHLPEFHGREFQVQSFKFMSIESMIPSSHLILCHPLLLFSIFPSIRVFSSESAVHIRWPKYWSFCFSISPSN